MYHHHDSNTDESICTCLRCNHKWRVVHPHMCWCGWIDGQREKGAPYKLNTEFAFSGNDELQEAVTDLQILNSCNVENLGTGERARRDEQVKALSDRIKSLSLECERELHAFEDKVRIAKKHGWLILPSYNDSHLVNLYKDGYQTGQKKMSIVDVCQMFKDANEPVPIELQKKLKKPVTEENDDGEEVYVADGVDGMVESG